MYKSITSIVACGVPVRTILIEFTSIVDLQNIHLLDSLLFFADVDILPFIRCLLYRCYDLTCEN